MAYEKESNKTFGGTAVPAGTYTIHSAIIDRDWFKDKSGNIKHYDTLEIILLDDTSNPIPATLKLNGCWNKRRGADGRAYSASGSFYDRLLKSQTGKTFSEVKAFISTNLAGYKIQISYKDYPAETGFARVPIVDIDLTNRYPVTPLPATWQPLRRPEPDSEETQEQPAPQPTGQPAPQSQPAGQNLPF